VLDLVFTGGLVTLFTQLNYSRELEQEADDRAPLLLLDSPYDPHAVPELMELLAEDFEGLRPRVPSIWTTHPEPEQRAAASRVIVAAMPERARHGKRSMRSFIRCARSRFATTSDDYPYTALALGQTMVEKYPGDLGFRMLLGDAVATLGRARRILARRSQQCGQVA
jgi:predicted Zn-dependent protease